MPIPPQRPAIGIKLLTEVMLKQRGNPLFEPLRSPVGEFIGKLKALSGLNAHR